MFGRKKFQIVIFCLLALFFIRIDSAFSASEDVNRKLSEEFKWLKEESVVITASRVPENIKRSASLTTVITEEQIRQMGARHLMDVLQTVPGMNAWYHPDGHYQVDSRGVSKVGGQDILIMINSHPVNSSFTGGATWVYDTLTLDNVRRIEVIRGPGSAMYGANAFSGVINILTKQAQDIDGVQMSASGGSYDTQQYNVLFGKTVRDLGIAFNFNYLKTDGYGPHFEKDGQNLWDQQISQQVSKAMGRPVSLQSSLAPGNSDTGEEKYDAALSLQYKGLKFDGRYVDRDRRPAASPLYTVNTDRLNNVNELVDYYLNLSYETKLANGLDILGKVYRNHDDYDASYQMLSGTTVLTPTGLTLLSKDGFTATPSNKNDRTGIEIQTTYKMGKSNTVVAGITYEKMKQYDVNYSANALYSPIPYVFIPLSTIQDLTDRQNYNQDASRDFKAIFVQDLWDITENIRLTVGARYDDYSDFGSSFNPRAGIAWEFVKGYDIKLLYGRAFRAPSFQELYNQNNPLQQGNPNLEAEKIDTYEISLGADFSASFSGRITGFKNSIKDNIISVRTASGTGVVFQNLQSLDSQGVEAELKYDFGKGTYLAANYTYQESEDADTNQSFYNIPKHKGNIIANIRFLKNYNWYADYHFQSGYDRIPGDTRGSVSFGTVNTTLIAQNLFKGLELRGSVYNLLDEKYKFPYPTAALPDDFEMPGRSFLIELKYKF